jgi:Amt family ammonium transporter
VPVHFINGIWGVLAVSIFAVGNPDTAAWNGVESPVTGIVGGSFGQILPQLLEIVSITAVAFGLSYAFFSVLKRAGVLRSRAEDELAGLDLPEMGEQGYVTDGVAVPGGGIELFPAPAAGTSPAGAD